MMCNHGLSKRIVIEYVNALIMQGLIKEEKGMLWATPNKSPTALQKEMNKVLAN